MKMNKRMAALPLLMILALGIIGFAYAMWWDEVTIKGTVEMGSLTMAFDYFEPPLCYEFWLNPETGTLVPGEYEDKEVGEQEVWYDDYIYDEHSDKDGWRTLYILVTNAYPSYRVHVTFKVHNIGTVVGHLVSYDFADDGSDEPITWVFNPADSENVGYFVNAAGVPIIDIEVVNNLPIQIDPCTTNKMEIDLHFKQPLLECHTYMFKVTLNFVSKLE